MKTNTIDKLKSIAITLELENCCRQSEELDQIIEKIKELANNAADLAVYADRKMKSAKTYLGEDAELVSTIQNTKKLLINHFHFDRSYFE